MLDGEFIEHVCDHSDRSAWNCMTLIAGKNATTTGQVLVAVSYTHLTLPTIA